MKFCALIACAFASAIAFASTSSHASTLNFNFSFTNTSGNISGTVSGEIDGLTDNATSAATAVFIDSAPAVFGLTTPFSVPVPPFGGNNEFTVANGVITVYSFDTIPPASPGFELVTGTAFTTGALSKNFCTPATPQCFTDGTPTSIATTPLPAALPLFASGLGALGLLGWRRKKKAAALAA